MIKEMLAQMSAEMAAQQLNDMKESDPARYEATQKMFVNAAELAINFLKESPEFRQAFARIHSEFLKCPESKSTIKQAIEAYQQYNQDE